MSQLVGPLREGDGIPQSTKPHVNARTQSVLMSTGVEELNNSQNNSKQSSVWVADTEVPKHALQ